MNPPWTPIAKSKPDPSSRRNPAKPRAYFVPCLESLEDRCLPSVIPYITFADGTSGQPVPGQSSLTLNNSLQPSLNVYQADVSVTVAYSGTTISYVSYASMGSVTLVPFGTSSFNTVAYPIITGSGSFSLVGVSAAVPIQDPVTQVYTFDLKLNSIQTDPTLSATRFSVSVDASNSAAGVNLNFAVTGLDPAGNKTLGTLGLINFGQSSATSLIRTASGGIQNGNSATGDSLPSSANNWSVTNPNGTSAFSVTLLNSNTISPQSSNSTQVLHATSPTIDANFVTAGDGISQGIGNFVPSGLGYFIYSTNPAGQFRLNRNSIVGPNSLVVADAGGIYVTLSITQEINLRTSNSSSLSTWTGARPPLEAPLRSSRVEDRGSKLDDWPLDDRSSILHLQSSMTGRVSDEESGPLEIMVANILHSLKEAKADDRAQDWFTIENGGWKIENEQLRVDKRDPAEEDFDSGRAAWISNTAWVSEERGDIAGLGGLGDLGDLNVSLKHLLEGLALNQSIALTCPDELAGPELTKNTAGAVARAEQPVASDKSFASSHARAWGWRALAECMATALLAFCWPGVVWPERASPTGNGLRGLRKEEYVG